MTFGLLFDLDGTLAHTDSLHEVAWKQALAEQGIDLGADGYLRRIRGRANPAIVADLLPALTPDQGAEVSSRKEVLFRSQARVLQSPPGAMALVEHARSEGWKMAVVTNAPRQNAEHILGVLGLKLSTVIAAEDVTEAKPAPEPFARGLSLLELPPDRAVAFEDSPSGIRSAVAAGLATVGMLTGHSSAELLEAGAEHVVEGFDAPQLLHWLRRRSQ